MLKLSARIKNKGFTLIELLIVIALLGALAIGLLATIDPFEQLKKGRDTSTRNTALEFYNAELRYNATRGTFTWATGTSIVTDALNNVDMTGTYIPLLTNAGELKSNFVTLAGTGNLALILVTSTSASQIGVCFAPQSKSFQVDPATLYDSSGGTSITNCKSGTAGTAGTNCYYCVQ